MSLILNYVVYNIFLKKLPLYPKALFHEKKIYFVKLIGTQPSNGDSKHLQSLHTFEMAIANIYKAYNASILNGNYNHILKLIGA